MKTVLIILGVILLLFIGFQVYVIMNRSSIESYPFEVVNNVGEIEIRTYESRLFTSVKMNTGKYDEASSKGFSILAGYIFGANESQEKIAMTSPVTMSLEDSTTMLFMVPKQYNSENLPKPNRTEIEFKEEPERKVAVIGFGGWANDQKIAEHKEELVQQLEANGIKYTDKFYVLGYNAPFDLLFRKNEVMVELE